MKIFFSLVVILLLSSCSVLNLNKQEDKGIEQNKVSEQQNEAEKESYIDTKTTLDLSNTGLDKLPYYVLSRSNLEILNIADNNIDGALPAEIKNLKNLKRLDASNNSMTGVPAEIGQMSNLEYLDLSNNNLTGLPYELGNLSALKELNIAGNNYAQQDLDIIESKLHGDVKIIK